MPVFNPLVTDLPASNSQPSGNETVPANYSAQIIGLSYVIPSGFVTVLGSNSVLVLTP